MSVPEDRLSGSDLDRELGALEVIVRALAVLDRPTQERLMRYLVSRFGDQS